MISSCCFDLETSSLDANFGIILCAVIKPADKKKPVVFRLDVSSPFWETKRSDDSSIVTEIVGELSKYDILVAHNGARFDVPFIRTRMAKWGMGSFPNKKLVDPVQLSRNKFRMGRNGLADLGSLLGAPEKTRVDGQVWLQAFLDGDKKAMDYIVAHCIQDVKILEHIVDAVKDYATAFNVYGSGY